MTAATTRIPSDYVTGLEKGRAIDPELARTYVEHTLIGDPLGEAAAAELAGFDQEGAATLIEVGMADTASGELAATPALRELLRSAEVEPDWLDRTALEPGVRMFHRNSNTVLAGFVAGVLIEGFTTNIARSFMLTGRVRDRGIRRLGQNNRHMTEIFLPGGLHREGDGWKLSVRIRIIHAQLRRMLNASDEWDAGAWGTPISAAHLGYAIAAFSARLLAHMKALGAGYNREERDSFMAVWRYTGHLMGIPGTILFRDMEDALRLYAVGTACEPEPSLDSIAMANSLVNSAPLLAGVLQADERQEIATRIYRISRGLLGDEVADALRYPRLRTAGTIPLFRLGVQCDRLLARLLPQTRSHRRLTRFGHLLDASTFDEEGLSYRLPAHIYSEEDSPW